MSDKIPAPFQRAAVYMSNNSMLRKYAEQAMALLRNSLFNKFWHSALGLIPEEKADDFACGLLIILATKGGVIPDENPSQKRKRRKGLANRIRSLCNAIKKDDVLRDLSLMDLLDLNGNENVLNIVETFREPKYDERYRDPFKGATVREAMKEETLSLITLLQSLETALRDFRRLNQSDELTLDKYTELTSSAGYSDAQERLVERQLCLMFERQTGSPRYALVGEALSALFGSVIDQNDIASRWRKVRGRKKATEKPQQVML
jgi:hypothetical protein